MLNARAPASALACLCLFLSLATHVAAGVFTCTGGPVYVVAHADDDLLFQSPDLYTDMKNNRCVTTLFLTAGDSGTTGLTYIKSREAGNEAATAAMAGVADQYTEFYAKFGGQSVLVRTLVGAPNVQKVWFRIPDGGMHGEGFSLSNYQSLRSLYFGSISQVTSKSKDATWTLATLKQAIGEILTARKPDAVRTLDYMSEYDSGDHADHLTTAKIVASLVGSYAPNAALAGYMGYPVQNFAPTMSYDSAEFQGKIAAFFAYTPYDSAECTSYQDCASANRGEAYWLTRQYIVNSELAQKSWIGSAQVPVIMPNGTNAAASATCSASSYSGGQPCSAALDGIVSGYPGNSSAEWASNSETVGATFTIKWPQPFNVTNIVLYDRPNQYDSIYGGNLKFSDGSTITFGHLANDGSATIVALANAVVTDTITMTVTAASPTSGSVGLAEFQAYGTACPGCAFTSATTADTITNRGIVSGTTAGADLALAAVATASSFSPAQPPDRAIDGVINGYPGNYSAEWASDGERVGAWLNLTWPAYYMMDSLTFHDRPNDGDWITGGHVDFDDGTSITVPQLNDDGSAQTVTFPAVNASSLRFTVTSVGEWTGNVGLAELIASYSQDQTPVNVTAPVSGLDPNVNSTVTSNSTTAILAIDLDDNLATTAIATASSSAPNQGPEKAIDTWVDGYKEDGTGLYWEEWATAGEKEGAWLQLDWTAPVTISQVVMYDRPNFSDRILEGILTFSDGTSRTFGALNLDGSATTINLGSPVTTKMLRMTVTRVSPTTGATGLADIALYGPAPNATVPYTSIVTNSTADITNSTITINSTVIVNATLANVTTALPSRVSIMSSASATLLNTSATASKAFNMSATPIATGNMTVSGSKSFVMSATPIATANASASGFFGGSSSAFNVSRAASSVPVATASASRVSGYASASSIYSAASSDASAAFGGVSSAAVKAASAIPTASANYSGIAASGAAYSGLSVNASAPIATASFNASAPIATANISATASAVRSGVSSAASVVSSGVSSAASVASSAVSAPMSSASAFASSAGSFASSVASNVASKVASGVSGVSSAFASATGSFLGSSDASGSFAASTPVATAFASSAAAASSIAAASSMARVSSVAAASSAYASSAVAASSSAAVASSASAAAAASSSAFAGVASSAAFASSASAAAASSIAYASSVAAAAAQSSIGFASSASAAAASSMLVAAASASAASVASVSAARASSAALSSASSFVVLTKSTSASASAVASSTVAASSSAAAVPTVPAFPLAPAQAPSVNIAQLGTATASSFRSSSPPKGVNDDIVGGLDFLGLGRASEEWSTGNRAVPAWVQLNFTSDYLVKTVYLFSPVNINNQVLDGSISFSDGSTVQFDSISNSGTAISLGAGKTIHGMRVTITQVGFIASAVGLAEIKMFNAAPVTCGWLDRNCLKTL